jgi:hypothetical protein
MIRTAVYNVLGYRQSRVVTAPDGRAIQALDVSTQCMKKKYASLLTTLLLAMLVCACGNGSSPGTTSSGSPPAVSSVFPPNNSPGAATRSPVFVTFDESMSDATINSMTLQVRGPNGPVAGSVTYSPSTNTAEFLSTSSYAPGTLYTVSVSSAVQSASAVAMLNTFTSTFTTSAATASGVPAQFQALDSSWNVYASSADALPGVFQDTGTTYIQPTFHTTVKRIGVSTASQAGHPASTSQYPFYSKEQAWSSDMAYLVLWSNDGWIHLLDGGNGTGGRQPYQYIESFGSGNWGCSADPEIRWSSDPRTPHRFYHICNARFFEYDVDAGTDVQLVDWNQKIPGKNFTYVYGPAEGNPSTSYDASCDCYDRYWAWGTQVSGSSGFYSVVVYDRFLDKGGSYAGNYPADNSGVIANVSNSALNVCPGGSSDIDWVSMSPDGDFVVIDYGNTSSSQTDHIGCGIGVYMRDANLTWQRQLFTTDYHSDIGYDAAGNEVVVSVYDDNTSYTQHSNICMFRAARLSDGQITRMQMWGSDNNGVEQNVCYGTTTGPIGFHVSMRGTVDSAAGLKGYALLSFYESTPIATQDTHLFGMEQVVLYVPGDGSTAPATHYRLGKTQSVRNGYNAEPHCVASPDFHRTLCGSNWRNPTSEFPVYPLVTELP